MLTANMRAPYARCRCSAPAGARRAPAKRVCLWWSPFERIRRGGCTKRRWTLQARAAGSRVAGDGSHRQAGRAKAEDLVQKLALVAEVLAQEGAPWRPRAPRTYQLVVIHFSCAQHITSTTTYVRATNEMHWDIPKCHNNGLGAQAGAHRCDLP